MNWGLEHIIHTPGKAIRCPPPRSTIMGNSLVDSAPFGNYKFAGKFIDLLDLVMRFI